MNMEQNQNLEAETQEKKEFQPIEIPQVNVSENGTVVASSLDIAKFFGKRHDNVLRDIENLQKEVPEEFDRLNFEDVAYVDAKGEQRPMYNLTRDGFALLAMGFTGKKALQFKVSYIQAFNAMEKALSAGHEKVEQVKQIEEPERTISPLKVSANCLYRNFVPRTTISKTEQSALRGLMHFVAYLEEVPIESVENYCLMVNHVGALDDLNSQKCPTAVAHLWSLARVVNKSIFPPRHEELEEHDKAILAKNALYGLMDFWKYLHGDITINEIENYILNICNIRTLEEIQSLKALQKALFVTYRGIYLTLSVQETPNEF